MTEELRWILLAAGLVLIAGVYLWGRRRAGRPSAPHGYERAAGHPPAPTPKGTAQAAHRVEPGFESPTDSFAGSRSAAVPDPLPVIELDREDAVVARPVQAGRREPRFDAAAKSSTPSPTVAEAAQPAPRTSQLAASPATSPATSPAAAAPPPEVPQKILALRIAAPTASPFDGRSLREAVVAEGLEFGRYKVFHRLHADGEPVFSLASLKEPGTFDPATMDGLSYRGVAMFAVLPGPLAPTQALDELLEAARAIAGRLGGVLQDDRGAALSVARVEQLRAEVAAMGRSRPTAPGR
jgi:cell division protein ZipA